MVSLCRNVARSLGAQLYFWIIKRSLKFVRNQLGVRDAVLLCRRCREETYSRHRRKLWLTRRSYLPVVRFGVMLPLLFMFCEARSYEQKRLPTRER